MDVGSLASLAALASSVDLGLSDISTQPTGGHDIPRQSIPGFLEAAAAFARARDLEVVLQLGGSVVAIEVSDTERLIRRAQRARHFRVLLTDRSGRMVENVLVRVWRRPGPARVSAGPAWVSESWASESPLAPVNRVVAPSQRTDATRRLPLDTAVGGPIDAVFTWVNGDDPAWRALISAYRPTQDADADRFVQVDELKYALRSVDLFAPWFRRVIIFTNCAPPPWFTGTDRIVWMDHADVVPEERLPLFNSHAIESYLHRIPDLSERFVYFNDDVLLWDSVLPATFFTYDGKSIAHLQERSSVPALMDMAAAGKTREWASAAVNSVRLLRERLGFVPTLLHQHSPFALRRSVLEEIEATWPEETERVRSTRFRSHSDVSWVSFFYHHYAIARGLGVAGHEEQVMLTERNHLSRNAFRRLSRATFVCINDGAGSGLNQEYQSFKGRFLEHHLPLRSSAEL